MMSARGGTVLGIDVKENSGAALEAVDEFGLSFPNLRDRDGSFVREWGQTGYPESYVIDRQGKVAAVRRVAGHAEVARRDAAAAARRGGLMRLALAALLALALLAPAAVAAAPSASLTDIEDEVMCLECGTALNVSNSAVADQEREFIAGADRAGQDQAGGQGRARRRVRPARAGRAVRRRLRADGLARAAAGRRWRARARRGSPRGAGAACDRPRRAVAIPRSRPTTSAGSTPSWRRSTGERRRRHHRPRRVRGRLRLVHLPLRAAARPRLPVGGLGRQRRGAAEGRALAAARAAARDRLLPLVHRRVRRARHDRDRPRLDAAGLARDARQGRRRR